MIKLILGLLMGGGILATIYEIYLHFTESREKLVEAKQSQELTKDTEKDKQDAETSKDSTDKFNDAVNEFERDNKS